MSVASEKIIIDQKTTEFKAFYEVQKMLKKIYKCILRTESKVNAYKESGLFNSIPTDTKAAYNRLYQLSLGLKTDFESDADFDELIDKE